MARGQELSVNLAILTGEVTKIGQLNHTPHGTPVINFTIATHEKWVHPDGRTGGHTEYHDCQAWDTVANMAMLMLDIGAEVRIKGNIRTSTWTRDGERRTKKQIVVTRIDTLNVQRRDGDNIKKLKELFA